MTRDEIQEAGASVLLDVLQESKHKNYYICPVCGKAKVYKPGNERNGKAFGLWSCLSCGARGDAFNALERQGMSARDAFAWVMERAGKGTFTGKPRRKVSKLDRLEAVEPDLDAWRVGCADYCRECAAALPGSEGERYLMSRGLDAVTLRRNLIGFDKRATAAGSLKYGCKAVVFPYDGECGYYSCRLIRPFTDKAGNEWRFVRPPADKAGGQPVFHGRQLWAEAEAVFVVESEIDCLSVVQAARLMKRRIGCVATGGANNTGALLRDLQGKLTAARLLIAFDNDTESGAGWDDARRLSARLTEIGQRHEIVVPWRAFGQCKDMNDILQDTGTAGLADVLDVILSEDGFTVTGEDLQAKHDDLERERVEGR